MTETAAQSPAQSAAQSAEATGPRPDFTPERGPMPLARNFEKRVGQLRAVAENPSESQLKQAAEKLAEEGDAENAQEKARNAFDNLSSLIERRDSAEQGLVEARHEALKASRQEFPEKLERLKEARKARAEAVGDLGTVADWFKDAGIQIEPQQRPLTSREERQKKWAERGWRLAERTHRFAEGAREKREAAAQTARETAARTRERAGEGAESVKERVVRAVEAGRERIRNVVESGQEAIARARQAAAQRYEEVRLSVQRAGEAAREKITEAAERGREVAEKTARPVTERFEAASAWFADFREAAVTQKEEIVEGFEELVSKARQGASERLDNFKTRMREAGERASQKKDELSERVKGFVSERAENVKERATAVKERISGEVRVAIEKSRIRLEPFWEASQKQKEAILDQLAVWNEKLGIVVEEVSDVARPIIDRIVDEGRDARDRALGFTREGVQGAQAFLRRGIASAQETTSPYWNALVERARELRSRANESRNRLNLFLGEALGPAANQFRKLRESTEARRQRAAQILEGVRREGSRIVQAGKEAPAHIKEAFARQGAAAREYMTRQKERVARGIEGLRRYWQVFAAEHWSGLSRQDFSRRMKLLGAAGAASARRAPIVVAGAGLAGVELGSRMVRMVRDPRGRVALLGVGALALALNAHNVSDNIQQILSNIHIPDVNLPAEGWFTLPEGGVGFEGGAAAAPPGAEVGAGGLEAGGAEAAGPVVGTEGGVPPAEAAAPPGEAPTVAEAAAPGAEGTAEAEGGGTEVAGAEEATAETGETAGEEAAGAEAGPLSVDQAIGEIEQGEPLDPQIRGLAERMEGNATENYYNLLQTSFERFIDNFETTARAVVDNPDAYDAATVERAQNQLRAINDIRTQGVDPSTPEGYNLLTTAMRYWRPIG